jgi:hypothetical protein
MSVELVVWDVGGDGGGGADELVDDGWVRHCSAVGVWVHLNGLNDPVLTKVIRRGDKTSQDSKTPHHYSVFTSCHCGSKRVMSDRSAAIQVMNLGLLDVSLFLQSGS